MLVRLINDTFDTTHEIERNVGVEQSRVLQVVCNII